MCAKQSLQQPASARGRRGRSPLVDTLSMASAGPPRCPERLPDPGHQLSVTHVSGLMCHLCVRTEPPGFARHVLAELLQRSILRPWLNSASRSPYSASPRSAPSVRTLPMTSVPSSQELNSIINPKNSVTEQNCEWNHYADQVSLAE